MGCAWLRPSCERAPGAAYAATRVQGGQPGLWGHGVTCFVTPYARLCMQVFDTLIPVPQGFPLN